MAYFRLRADAQTWFSEIRGAPQIKVMFDRYYFCLMTGIAAERSSEQGLVGTAASDPVEDFTNDYKPTKLLLIGLLVVAELKKEGIDVSEKAAVCETFKSLAKPLDQSQLTAYGVKRMNAYASAGYEYGSDAYVERPVWQGFLSATFRRDGAVICPALRRGHRPLATMRSAMLIA